MDYDIITVQLVPEKKGLFLKHSEYEVSLKVVVVLRLFAGCLKC